MGAPLQFSTSGFPIRAEMFRSPTTAPGRQHHDRGAGREMGASKTRTGWTRETGKQYPGSQKVVGRSGERGRVLSAWRISVWGVAHPTDRGPAPRLQLLPSCFCPRFLALSAPRCCGHHPRWGLYPLPSPHLSSPVPSQGMLGICASWTRVLQVLGETIVTPPLGTASLWAQPHPRGWGVHLFG